MCSTIDFTSHSTELEPVEDIIQKPVIAEDSDDDNGDTQVLLANSDEEVQEALEQYKENYNIVPDRVDVSENADEDDSQQFHTQGCTCSIAEGKPCSSLFSVEYLTSS